MNQIYWLSVAWIAFQRCAELVYSRRNKKLLREVGFRNFESALAFAPMVLVHTGWLGGMILESYYFPAALPNGLRLVALGVFCFAQLLRFWAQNALGRQWNVNIMRPQPGISEQQIVLRGPYRFVRHPNYTAVILEIVSLPLVGGAVLTALICSIANALVLKRRIGVEESLLMADPQYLSWFQNRKRFIPGLI